METVEKSEEVEGKESRQLIRVAEGAAFSRSL